MEAMTTTPAPTGAESTSGDSTLDVEPKGQNVDTGKLFELPKIRVDTTSPTVLKTAFSGQVEFERNEKEWAEFFNKLEPGKSHKLTVTVFASGGKKTHRRDAEGNVDAVVQTKSLIVTDIHDA